MGISNTIPMFLKCPGNNVGVLWRSEQEATGEIGVYASVQHILDMTFMFCNEFVHVLS